MWRAMLLSLLIVLTGADAPPASKPAAIDVATWQRMLDIDRKAAEIEDLVADFEQQKFTPMLRKPLVSSGRVFVRGSSMLWETDKPQRGSLQITPDEVRIYYPSEKTIEVYRIEEKLGQLAASPLPRLETLQKNFTFVPLPLAEMGESSEADFLSLRLTPVQAELREHVEEVRVLLDARSGLMMKLEMRDLDGERTVIHFTNARPNAGLRDEDLRINAPADVKITRPLQALER
jgi:outer membrane lipoprotein-sorting protein